MEKDNAETDGRENRSANENSEEDDECWKRGSGSNRVEWVSDILTQGQHTEEEVRKMRNRQGIQKSSLVAEESDMKRNFCEVLALLRRRVKEMRANGKMDAQHNAGAVTQAQRQIKEVSRDINSSFYEFRNKRVKCCKVEHWSGKQKEGRECVKSHFIPLAEASFR